MSGIDKSYHMISSAMASTWVDEEHEVIELNEKSYVDTSSEMTSTMASTRGEEAIDELIEKMYGIGGTSFEMQSAREEEVVDELNEKLYVAVSKDLKTCKSALVWALKNSGGKKVCLIHVHQPAQTISVMGGRFPVSSLSKQEVRAHQEKERQIMCNILNEYLQICAKAGVQAEKLHIEMDSVEDGIVGLIKEHKIERLVMGAAADNRYSRKMMEPKSKKANYVREHAPAFCHMWFICKGRLIYTREGTKQSQLDEDDISSSGWHTPISREDALGSFDDNDLSSRFSFSRLSGYSQSSEAATSSTSTSSSFSRTVEQESSLWSLALPPTFKEIQDDPIPFPKMRVIKLDQQGSTADAVHDQLDQAISLSPNFRVIKLDKEGDMNDTIYDQLDQAIAEAKIAKREAFQETMKRAKAEKEAIDAIRKAKAAETFYCEESRRRKEIEKELARAKEELESTKKERDMVLEELQVALNQKKLLETRVQKSDVMGKELENKIISTLALLQSYKQL